VRVELPNGGRGRRASELRTLGRTEARAGTGRAIVDLPLFPLHTVLFPGIALPLHIFEPRYRLMVARCLTEALPFGVSWIREGREVGAGDLAIAEVGTMAEIRDATPLPDGRYEVVAVGTRRFRIVSVDTDAEPYLLAEVEPLDEIVRDEGRARRLTRVVTRRFIHYVERVRELADEEAEEPDDAVIAAALAADAATEEGTSPPLDDDVAGMDAGDPGRRILAIPGDPTLLSHLLSGIVELDLPRRQGLLERETTDARLGDLAGILAREIAFLDGRLRVFAPDPRLQPAARN
jgi:Lon protease-like protein